MYDVAIRGGTVVDGTGQPARMADVAVVGDRIVAVGDLPAAAAREIDARGMVVAPGFIDIHSHSDYTLLIDPRAVSSIYQGVTTEVIGNCGFGCAPIRDATIARGSIYGFDGSVELSWKNMNGYLERLAAARPAVNVLTLVPNGQLRRSVLGVSDAAAPAKALSEMEDLLREGLDAGAFGYSTGLEYPAESGAPPAEIASLCRIVAARDRLYATHTRHRDEGCLDAIAEAITTAKKTGVRLQLSHLAPRKTDENEIGRALDMVDDAKHAGIDLHFDMHTRLFGFTFLSVALPSWAVKDGRAALKNFLADAGARQRMKLHKSIVNSGGWDRVSLLDVPVRPELSGRCVAEIARAEGRDPFDICLDILLKDIDQIDRTMVMIQTYTGDQQALILPHELCMPASDATTLAPDGPLRDRTFHGAYSWAAWFFRFAVNTRRLLSLEEAVYRLSGLPAKVLRLSDAGHILAGKRADLAIFDPERFSENATVNVPNQLASGMRHVFVGGTHTLDDGALTGSRGGKVLRAPS